MRISGFHFLTNASIPPIIPSTAPIRSPLIGIKVNGTAEIVEHNGMFGPGKYLQIAPTVSWSWGIKDFGSQRKENFLSRLFTLVIDRGSNTALLRSNVNKGSNHREPHFSYDVVSLAPIN